MTSFLDDKKLMANLLNSCIRTDRGLLIGIHDSEFVLNIRDAWKGKVLHINEILGSDGISSDQNKSIKSKLNKIPKTEFSERSDLVFHDITGEHQIQIFDNEYFDWIMFDSKLAVDESYKDIHSWYAKLKANGYILFKLSLVQDIANVVTKVKKALEQETQYDTRVINSVRLHNSIILYVKKEKPIREAIVTFAVGDYHAKIFNDHFRDSLEKYSAAIDVPLHIFYKAWDNSSRSKDRNYAWQKLLMFEQPELERYDRICWVDCDILATNTKENIFDNVPPGNWGAVKESLSLAPSDEIKEIYRIRNMETTDLMLNTGVFVVDRNEHSDLFRMMYNDDFEINSKYEKIDNGWYEQPLLSRSLTENYKGVFLPVRFNRLIPRFLPHFNDRQTALKTLFLSSVFMHWPGNKNSKFLESDLKFVKELNENCSVDVDRNDNSNSIIKVKTPNSRMKIAV